MPLLVYIFKQHQGHACAEGQRQDMLKGCVQQVPAARVEEKKKRKREKVEKRKTAHS